LTTSWFPPTRVPALRGGPTLGSGIIAPGSDRRQLVTTVLAKPTRRSTPWLPAPRDGRRVAERHQIDLVYEGYEKLLTDPQADIVYMKTSLTHLLMYRLRSDATDSQPVPVTLTSAP
jgi:hypothetical protein